MHSRAGETRQLDVAMDHQLLGDARPAREAEPAAARALVHDCALGEPGDLAVLGERDAETQRVLEGATHQQRVLHAIAVVGEQRDTGGRQLGERRQLLAEATDRDAARGRHLAEAGGDRLRPHELDDADRVLRGIGVRHRHDRRVPAERGRTRPGLDRLGLLVTGLAQMGVEVDEARTHHAPGGVEHDVTVAVTVDVERPRRPCHRRSRRRRGAPRTGRVRARP